MARCPDCDPDEGPTAAQERDHLAEQCTTLLRENELLQAANAKLRQILQVAYGAMKAAIGKCQATVDECLTESDAVKDKRLAIFGDLDIPLARVGCTVRASDEALAEVDARIAAALASNHEQLVPTKEG